MGRVQIVPHPYAGDALALLGAQIRVARTERGWTQADLAARAGCSSRTLSHIEKGRPEPSIGTVFNCCAALGMRLFGAEPAELARMSRDARRISALIPQRVVEPRIDDDF